MSTNIMSTNIKKDKIKVSYLRILTHNIEGAPYYELLYKKLGAHGFNEGYGSYDFNIVLDYIKENFEIMEDKKMSKGIVAKFEKVSFNQWLQDCYLLSKEVYDKLIIPKRATKGSAGYDFFAPINFVIPPHGEIKIPTGIKCKITEGFVLEIYPRSSLGFKHRISLSNTVGIIDSDYYGNESNEGHIFIKLYNPKDALVSIAQGEAFAQGIFKSYYFAEEEDVTEERTGGMGSTNK